MYCCNGLLCILMVLVLSKTSFLATCLILYRNHYLQKLGGGHGLLKVVGCEAVYQRKRVLGQGGLTRRSEDRTSRVQHGTFDRTALSYVTLI